MSQINYPFAEQIIHDPQDLTHLSWSKIRHSSGTAGSFLKAQETAKEGKLYYKLSDYNQNEGIVGHESVNEIIADRLLTILDIPHLSYRLIHADIIVDGAPFRTWLCASYDFRRRGEQKSALDTYYAGSRLPGEYYGSRKLPGESPLDFCLRMGWSEYIYQMLVFDYLILNRDRHGANMEVLENRYRQTVRLAPLFDHGLSLLCRCLTLESLEKADVMEDKTIQCFVGSRSARKNLDLIPRDQFPQIKPLQESDRAGLLDGLDDALDPRWLDKIWDMIWRRYCQILKRIW